MPVGRFCTLAAVEKGWTTGVPPSPAPLYPLRSPCPVPGPSWSPQLFIFGLGLSGREVALAGTCAETVALRDPRQDAEN